MSEAEKTKSVGRPGLSEEDYTKQITAWLDQGQRIEDITATKLQKAVGGQYRKVVDILSKFKGGYEARAVAALPDLPDAFMALLNDASIAMWRHLWERKEEEVATATAAFGVERADLQAISAEYLEVIERHEDRLADQEETIDRLREKVEGLENQLVEKSQQQADQKLQLVQVTERAEQLDQRLKDKTVEGSALTDDLSATRSALEKSHGVQTELSGQVRDLKADLGKITAENNQRGRMIEAEQVANRSLEEAQDTMRAAFDQCREALAAERASGQAMKERLTLLETDTKTLTDNLTAATQESATKTAQVEQLQERLTESQAAAQTLQDQLINLAGAPKKSDKKG